MGECRETANFVMASAENLSSNIQLEKLDISTRLLFFAFFQFSNRSKEVSRLCATHSHSFVFKNTITLLRGDEVKINF